LAASYLHAGYPIAVLYHWVLLGSCIPDPDVLFVFHCRRCALFKSDGIGELIKIVNTLPTYVKRGVYRALTEAGKAVEEKAVGDENYWGRFLQPLQDRFNAIVNGEDARRNYQNENVRSELLDILECLAGTMPNNNYNNIFILNTFGDKNNCCRSLSMVRARRSCICTELIFFWPQLLGLFGQLS